MIELPVNFVSNIAASSTEFFGELSPLAVLLISIFVGAIVLEILIFAIRHRGG